MYPNTVKTYDAAFDVILVAVDGSFLKRSFVGEEEASAGVTELWV